MVRGIREKGEGRAYRGEKYLWHFGTRRQIVNLLTVQSRAGRDSADFSHRDRDVGTALNIFRQYKRPTEGENCPLAVCKETYSSKLVLKDVISGPPKADEAPLLKNAHPLIDCE